MKRKLFNSLTEIKGFFKEMFSEITRILKAMKNLESNSSVMVA